MLGGGGGVEGSKLVLLIGDKGGADGSCGGVLGGEGGGADGSCGGVLGGEGGGGSVGPAWGRDGDAAPTVGASAVGASAEEAQELRAVDCLAEMKKDDLSSDSDSESESPCWRGVAHDGSSK